RLTVRERLFASAEAHSHSTAHIYRIRRKNGFFTARRRTSLRRLRTCRAAYSSPHPLKQARPCVVDLLRFLHVGCTAAVRTCSGSSIASVVAAASRKRCGLMAAPNASFVCLQIRS